MLTVGGSSDSWMTYGLVSPITTASSKTTFLAVDDDGRSYIVSSSTLSRIVLKPLAPRLAFHRSLRNRAQCVIAELELHAFHVKEFPVLLRQRILRLKQDTDQRVLVEFFERRHNRQAANKFGYQSIANSGPAAPPRSAARQYFALVRWSSHRPRSRCHSSKSGPK